MQLSLVRSKAAVIFLSPRPVSTDPPLALQICIRPLRT